MEILNFVPFDINFAALCETLRLRAGSSHINTVRKLVDEAEQIARPKAIYKVAFVDEKGDDYLVVDGLKFTSRVLRVNIAEAHRVFAFVITSGREMEDWVHSKPDFIEEYWADMINQTVLASAVRNVESFLTERFGLGPMSRMNPGSLADWPLAQQRVLFALIGDTEGTIGVRLLDSLLMSPSKTVSGILFPTEESFASCQLCPRENCPNRRAPYDATLFERKYQQIA